MVIGRKKHRSKKRKHSGEEKTMEQAESRWLPELSSHGQLLLYPENMVAYDDIRRNEERMKRKGQRKEAKVGRDGTEEERRKWNKQKTSGSQGFAQPDSLAWAASAFPCIYIYIEVHK